MVTPDYIFESSWEVCNKVGGIYTVLSSKARTLRDRFKDHLIFIGPDLKNNPQDFEDDETLFSGWKKKLPDNIKVKTGRWKIPGYLPVILIDFKLFFDDKNSLYYEMWENFGVDSYCANGDYDESCIFAYSAGIVIENFYNFHNLLKKKVIAHFNEWTLGMGALYIKKHLPEIATVFTTHATTTGRSITGNNKPLYDHLSSYDGDAMASELGVKAKHSLEKQTAKHVDCFTTVSEITAEECKQLLDKKVDIVTPNGFENDFVPKGSDYDKKRKEARKLLSNVLEKLTGKKISKNAFFVATSGRYEYRNKGIDVFIETINKLRNEGLKREIVAFIMVPAWVSAPRADLKYMRDTDIHAGKPLQTPFITHWLNNANDDRILNFILQKDFKNDASENVNIIFSPCYLDNQDGILNKSYYDLLTGMDATVFASYYEPWGYTPLESVAFGIPTITTNLTGFGLWAKNEIEKNKSFQSGVEIIERDDNNYFEAAEKMKESMLEYAAFNPERIKQARAAAKALSEEASWSHFIRYYLDAYDVALQKKVHGVRCTVHEKKKEVSKR
jgi:glycosyltransferase involved in cell wall biosynthesis